MNHEDAKGTKLWGGRQVREFGMGRFDCGLAGCECEVGLSSFETGLSGL